MKASANEAPPHDKFPSLQQLATEFGYEIKGRLLTTEEVAAWLSKPKNVLEIDRCKGRGPKYLRLGTGRLIRYAERDVLLWLWQGNARKPLGAVQGRDKA